VDEVIDELSLTAHFNTRTAGPLSGGQAESGSTWALETGSPSRSLLFLDEAPPPAWTPRGWTKSVMELMRRAGQRTAGTVIIVNA